MTSFNPKNMSPFGLSALELDSEFAQLEQLSGQIDRLAIDTESGLELARNLLGKFAQCGERIGLGVKSLAKELEDARTRAEKAAEIVSARANAIQERQLEADKLLERFQALGEMAKKITEAVTQLRGNSGGQMPMNDEQRTVLIGRLPEINTQIDVLIEEAFRLKDDASTAKLKTLERNADSLGQSLRHARGRLNSVMESGPSPTVH
jgi:hypothetical protein